MANQYMELYTSLRLILTIDFTSVLFFKPLRDVKTYLFSKEIQSLNSVPRADDDPSGRSSMSHQHGTYPMSVMSYSLIVTRPPVRAELVLF